VNIGYQPLAWPGSCRYSSAFARLFHEGRHSDARTPPKPLPCTSFSCPPWLLPGGISPPGLAPHACFCDRPRQTDLGGFLRSCETSDPWPLELLGGATGLSAAEQMSRPWCPPRPCYPRLRARWTPRSRRLMAHSKECVVPATYGRAFANGTSRRGVLLAAFWRRTSLRPARLDLTYVSL